MDAHGSVSELSVADMADPDAPFRAAAAALVEAVFHSVLHQVGALGGATSGPSLWHSSPPGGSSTSAGLGPVPLGFGAEFELAADGLAGDPGAVAKRKALMRLRETALKEERLRELAARKAEAARIELRLLEAERLARLDERKRARHAELEARAAARLADRAAREEQLKRARPRAPHPPGEPSGNASGGPRAEPVWVRMERQFVESVVRPEAERREQRKAEIKAAHRPLDMAEIRAWEKQVDALRVARAAELANARRAAAAPPDGVAPAKRHFHSAAGKSVVESDAAVRGAAEAKRRAAAKAVARRRAYAVNAQRVRAAGGDGEPGVLATAKPLSAAGEDGPSPSGTHGAPLLAQRELAAADRRAAARADQAAAASADAEIAAVRAAADALANSAGSAALTTGADETQRLERLEQQALASAMYVDAIRAKLDALNSLAPDAALAPQPPQALASPLAPQSASPALTDGSGSWSP